MIDKSQQGIVRLTILVDEEVCFNFLGSCVNNLLKGFSQLSPFFIGDNIPRQEVMWFVEDSELLKVWKESQDSCKLDGGYETVAGLEEDHSVLWNLVKTSDGRCWGNRGAPQSRSLADIKL
jgi:hypothetical protein